MFLVFCLHIVWYFFSSVPLWRAFVTDNFSDLLAKWLELSSFSFLVSVNFLPHEFLWAHLRSTLYWFPSFFYCEVYFFKRSYTFVPKQISELFHILRKRCSEKRWSFTDEPFLTVLNLLFWQLHFSFQRDTVLTEKQYKHHVNKYYQQNINNRKLILINNLSLLFDISIQKYPRSLILKKI